MFLLQHTGIAVALIELARAGIVVSLAGQRQPVRVGIVDFERTLAVDLERTLVVDLERTLVAAPVRMLAVVAGLPSVAQPQLALSS